MNKKQLLYAAIILLISACVTKAPTSNDHESVNIDIIVPEHGMADPHPFVQDDTVFVFCGHDKSIHNYEKIPMDRWEIWSSTDLVNWNFHRSIYPTQTYIGDKPNCWAGDICMRNGKYYWFFSNQNINTGVAVANEIDGEYTDLLGEPILPEGLTPVHNYDPAIFVEDGVYHICFGAGQYYMTTLSEDMKSLSSKPKRIVILNEKGDTLGTEDKSTLFKNGEWYYLVYGHRYAISKKLYGPYLFKGDFYGGGHTGFFKWKDQWYVLQENHEISSTFRGVGLHPVYFNADGSLKIPEEGKFNYPAPGRKWIFERSTMGWISLQGTTINWDKDAKMHGNIDAIDATIISAPRLFTDAKLCTKISFTIKNETNCKEIKIAIHSVTPGPAYWGRKRKPVDWSLENWVNIPIEENTNEYKTYSILLLELPELNERIQQIAIKPAPDVSEGSWSIRNITID